MGNGEDTDKIISDRIDGGNEAIAPFPVLSAKTFIDDQQL